MSRQKIRTFLWYDNKAEEAAHLYVSLFKNSRVGKIVPGPSGLALTVEFTLDGIDYIALNGGPHYKFTEAISLSVACETQAEVDELWAKLSEGGSEGRCGWLKDKYGLSWQIVPSILGKLLSQPDPAKSQRVMGAFMQMTKLDIDGLQAAAEGR